MIWEKLRNIDMDPETDPEIGFQGYFGTFWDVLGRPGTSRDVMGRCGTHRNTSGRHRTALL